MKRLRPLKNHTAVLLACLVFTLATLGAPPRGVGQEAPRTAAPAAHPGTITLAVGVNDKYGRYVAELKKENFTVYDQKVPQEIIAFDDQDAPASVSILLDASPSMLGRGNLVNLLRASALRFIQRSNKANDYLIIGFADSVQVLADWGSSDESLVRALNELGTTGSKKGRTALHDACYLGIEKLKGSTRTKRVLLLLTDGWDSGSRHTLDEVHRALKESDVVVYAVAVGDGDASTDETNVSMLKRLADISGGLAFFPATSAEAEEIFARIRLEVQHQYLISYRPSNVENDGKWHHIKVKVAPLPNGPRLPSVTVRAREGYYAAPSLPGPKTP